ncbi:MAG: nucleoside hydrolase [Bacteroidales bacterium]
MRESRQEARAPERSRREGERSRRSISVGLLVVSLVIGLFIVARQPAEMPGRFPLIVDTDAGTDDLLALSYLLARPEIDIQMVASVNGISHAEAGARNVLRLLRVANRRIPVYVGLDQPLEGRAAFPAEWRRLADEMEPLPPLMGRRVRPDAVNALLDRVRTSPSPVTILALGPLTNIGEAIARDPRTMAGIEQLVIMGGAIDVAGNAPETDQSPVAEWNIYIDPTAASLVFRSGLPITLVPLDATNGVPIDRNFVKDFNAHQRSPLGITVSQLLDSAAAMIDSGAYFAWDPLAAVAVVDPTVIATRPLNVSVLRTGDQRGRLVAAPDDPNANVAYKASASVFKSSFFGALTHR